MTEKEKESIYKPLNSEFCSFLEQHLCNTFSHSNDKTLINYWCDGVDASRFNNSLSAIHKIKTIEIKAWIGKDGNDEAKRN